MTVNDQSQNVLIYVTTAILPETTLQGLSTLTPPKLSSVSLCIDLSATLSLQP